MATYTPDPYPVSETEQGKRQWHQAQARKISQAITNNLMITSTFAKLPPATTGQGAVITDSNTVTWGANIAGGGTNTVRAWYNGTHWTVMGK
jgi:hypothetical protein